MSSWLHTSCSLPSRLVIYYFLWATEDNAGRLQTFVIHRVAFGGIPCEGGGSQQGSCSLAGQAKAKTMNRISHICSCRTDHAGWSNIRAVEGCANFWPRLHPRAPLRFVVSSRIAIVLSLAWVLVYLSAYKTKRMILCPSFSELCFLKAC